MPPAETQPLLAKPGLYGRPSISPDGQRLALEVTEGTGTDLWVYDWQRDTMTRLTFTGTASAPRWSPDGRYIAFRTLGTGTSAIRSDGAGKPQPLVQSKDIEYVGSFTPDGKRLAYQEQGLGTSYDLWIVPLESDARGAARAGKPEVFLQTPAELKAVLFLFYPDEGAGWPTLPTSRGTTQRFMCEALPGQGRKVARCSGNGGGTYAMWSRHGSTSYSSRLRIGESWCSDLRGEGQIRSWPTSHGCGPRKSSEALSTS